MNTLRSIITQSTIAVVALGFVWAGVGAVMTPDKAHAQSSKTISGDKSNYDDESGIENWEFRIYEYSEGSVIGEAIDTGSTDQNGNFSLTVDPVDDNATYLVCEEDKTGWNQTSPTLDESGTAECPNGTVGYTVNGDATWSDRNPGFMNEQVSTGGGDTDGGGGDILEPRDEPEPERGSISGTKRSYETETGLPGWKITLHEFWSQSDGYAEDPERTTTTDTNNPDADTNEAGEYQFEDLPAGDYLVCEENRAGWTQTAPTDQGGTYECENGTVGHVVTVGEEGAEIDGNDFMNDDGAYCQEYAVNEDYEEGDDELVCEEPSGGSEDGGGDGGDESSGGDVLGDFTPDLPDTGDGSMLRLISGPSK